MSKYITLAWNGREGKGKFTEAATWVLALIMSIDLAHKYEHCAIYELNDDGTFTGVKKWHNGEDGDVSLEYDSTSVLKFIAY